MNFNLPDRYKKNFAAANRVSKSQSHTDIPQNLESTAISNASATMENIGTVVHVDYDRGNSYRNETESSNNCLGMQPSQGDSLNIQDSENLRDSGVGFLEPRSANAFQAETGCGIVDEQFRYPDTSPFLYRWQ